MGDTRTIAVDVEMRVGKEWRACHITVQPGSLQFGSCHGKSVQIIPTCRTGLQSEIEAVARAVLCRNVTCHVDEFRVDEDGTTATIAANWPDDAVQFRIRERRIPSLADVKDLWMMTRRE